MDNTIAKMKNILMGCAVAVTLSAALASCADDMDLFGNPNALQIEVEDEWTAQPGTRAIEYSEGGIHSEFQTGDAVGIYAFDGARYVYSNVKFTKQSDGTWTGAQTIDYNPSYTYYAYFPYDDAATYSPSTSGTVDDVDTRFADFISDSKDKYWKSDQSTKANFDQSNLMIAKGTVTTAPHVKFVMNHKRGLAVIEPANKWYYNDFGTAKYSTSIVSFNGNIPYAEPSNGGNNLFLTKPSESTNVGGTPVTIAEGKYVVVDGIEGLTNSSDIEFTASTSDDDGFTWSEYSSTAPSWLSVGIDNQTEPYNFAIAFPYLYQNDAGAKKADTELVSRTAVTNRDLSMVDNAGKSRSARTTANCYLVHAPGTYHIPLVYGNAIKNGKTNESAYKATASGNNVLQNFVNHKDAAITDPWIKNNGITVDGAKLIWEDMKGMINNVGIDGDYLTFTVDKARIAEGNAVVSATSNGTVVWSWHIWVTKQTLETTTAVNTGSLTYNVADVNLGAVDAKYTHKHCRIRATANGVTIQFEVVQPNFSGENNSAQSSSIATYYQWGRPVALPPYETSNLYNSQGGRFTLNKISSDANTMTIGYAIQHPEAFCVSPSNGPYKGVVTNYWNINETPNGDWANVPTSKTIYDPCPPDFCVPTDGLYTYLTNQSTKYLQYGEGGPGDLFTVGSSSLFLPLSYSMDADGKVNEDYTYYWGATSEYSQTYSYGSFIGMRSSSYSGSVDALRYSCCGSCIRPVRE